VVGPGPLIGLEVTEGPLSVMTRAPGAGPPAWRVALFDGAGWLGLTEYRAGEPPERFALRAAEIASSRCAHTVVRTRYDEVRGSVTDGVGTFKALARERFPPPA
jgi:hypothetical protein